MSLYLGSNKISNMINYVPTVEKDVNFYDYEGTLLYSYTKAEALALTALPPLPDRTSENLTNEGWNMTIADIAERINKGMFYVAVGCIYHTTDWRTHITVIPDDSHTTAYLYITPSIANDTTVNWGDGSSDTISSTSATQLSHTYGSNLFDTEIDLTIESTSGTHMFTTYIGGSQNNNIANKFTKINLSSKSRVGGAYGDNIFSRLRYLEYISIHNDILKDVSPYPYNLTYFLGYDPNLKHLNIPNNCVLGNGICYQDSYLLRASIPLARSGYNLFAYCSNLNKSEVLFNRGSMGSDNVSLYNMYRQCNKMKCAYVDERVTKTESYAFFEANLGSLEVVKLPASLEIISSDTFNYNYNLKEVYLKATTPPTLNAVFTYMNTFYKIFVPRNSYSSYITASNWSDIASHIYPYDYE